MKKLMITILVLFGLMIIGIFAVGIYSHTPPELGLVQGKLRPCSSKPNCVCSEIDKTDVQHSISPLPTAGIDDHIAWTRLIDAVKASGGSIQQHSNTYMHATFTSFLFRFVDDFEARLDSRNHVIHIRSASRVGHSDLGINRKRLEKIRLEYGSHLPSGKDRSVVVQGDQVM